MDSYITKLVNRETAKLLPAEAPCLQSHSGPIFKQPTEKSLDCSHICEFLCE